MVKSAQASPEVPMMMNIVRGDAESSSGPPAAYDSAAATNGDTVKG
jgi:hypothetical protein